MPECVIFGPLFDKDYGDKPKNFACELTALTKGYSLPYSINIVCHIVLIIKLYNSTQLCF